MGTWPIPPWARAFESIPEEIERPGRGPSPSNLGSEVLDEVALLTTRLRKFQGRHSKARRSRGGVSEIWPLG